MNRRHLIKHVISSAIFSNPASQLIAGLNGGSEKKKSVITIWLGGGPSTIDMWDLKPDINSR